MNGFWKVVVFTILLAFPFVVVAVFDGPDDTYVLRGQTATLQCSNGDFLGGIRQWSEGGDVFANQDGVFSGPTLTKYQDFQIDAPTSTQIDLIIPDAQVADEGSYECQITPDKATAAFKVEIQGNTPTITLNGDSSGDPIILTADVESTLRCTATGYRPAANLEWYKNNVKITAGVSEDSPTVSGDTFDTSGTLTLTPTKDDNEASVECRTTGQQVAPPQTGSLISINVQYKPVVLMDQYSMNTISCSADANPITNIQYVIYLNDTAQGPGKTLKYNNDDYGCTSVRCDVTNNIGTGTAEIVDGLCPGDTTTTATTTAATNATGKPAPQTNVAVIAAAVVIPLLILLIIICVLICYKQKKLCFAPSKTGTSGSVPKKQPSASNADMIRNQPEVRQSVHKYDDEPKKPRIARSTTGNSKKQSVNDAAPRQSGGSPVDDHRGSESPDGRNQESGGQGGVNYADLEFQGRRGDTNGHGQIHYPAEEQTQYASILV